MLRRAFSVGRRGDGGGECPHPCYLSLVSIRRKNTVYSTTDGRGGNSSWDEKRDLGEETVHEWGLMMNGGAFRSKTFVK